MLFLTALLKTNNMQIKYFNDTDTLLLILNEKPVASTEDVNENVLVDLDAQGNPVSFTIEHARQMTDVMDFSFQHVAEAV